jgi:hypothetical protein
VERSEPRQSDFIHECERLHRAQLDAKTTEDRDAADDALRHFLRMHHAGRLQEYFASRQEEESQKVKRMAGQGVDVRARAAGEREG